MTTLKQRFVPVVLVSLGLAVAACGSDSSSGDVATTAGATQTTAAASDTTAAGGTETTVASDCKLDAPLKIGFAADLGELGAFSDQPGSEAAKVMVDQINAAGGVGGKPVEYEVKDIQGDPAATQRAAQELLDDGVNAIIGPPFASTGAPLLDTVAGKAPVIFMASTDPALADPTRGAFLASFSDPVQASAMAEFALGKGFTKAVTFSSTDDVYFSGNPEYFTKVFTDGGGNVLQDFSYSLADTDFSTQVNAISAMSDKPEVLFTAMVMPQTQTLLEQLEGRRPRRHRGDGCRRLRRHRGVERRRRGQRRASSRHTRSRRTPTTSRSSSTTPRRPAPTSRPSASVRSPPTRCRSSPPRRRRRARWIPPRSPPPSTASRTSRSPPARSRTRTATASRTRTS